jgi:hypothetical protein
MARLPLDQAARLTELGKVTVTRAIKCSWLSAGRKKDGSYEVDTGEPSSPRRLHALTPWRAARLADLRADDAPLCPKCKTRMKVRTLLPGREFNDVDYRCEDCGEKALRSVPRGR